jgi:hypothetical protein
MVSFLCLFAIRQPKLRRSLVNFDNKFHITISYFILFRSAFLDQMQQWWEHKKGNFESTWVGEKKWL